MIHKPLRAYDPHAQSCRRLIPAAQNSVKVRNSRTRVRNPNLQHLGCEELDLSSAGIPESVPRDLGHGGRDARLLLWIEPEQGRNCSGPLACGHDIALASDFQSE
jgi:hypothetical protein